MTIVALVASGPSFASSPLCSEANINEYFNQTEARASGIDKEEFYRLIKPVFAEYEDRGPHFEGTDAILDRWNSDDRLKDTRWLAYILATSYHETARQMFPVREHLASSDDAAIRIFKKNKIYNNTNYWHKNRETGQHYFGRGYVQLTWDYNYQRADKRFDIDNRKDSFYWNPDHALDPERAIEVTYDGMIYGWYTGHCLLLHFQPNRRADWINARRIINGLDRADLIAGHAVQFLMAIDGSTRINTVVRKEQIDTPTIAAQSPEVQAPSVQERAVQSPRATETQTPAVQNIAAMEARAGAVRMSLLEESSQQGATQSQSPAQSETLPETLSENSELAAADQAEAPVNNQIELPFEDFQSFVIWISPTLSCIVWLLSRVVWVLAQIAVILTVILEWLSGLLFMASEWLSQSSGQDEITTTINGEQSG